MIRLYGVEKGNSSWPRVTGGVRRGLRMLGQYEGFYDVGDVDAEYDDDSMGRGYDAKVGLCVGPPPAASVMIGRGHHSQRLLMIATNSTWLPEAMMQRACKMVTGFIGTSTWASGVISEYAEGKPVYTYLHGVESGFRVSCQPKRASFSVLHLASTHMQRKGTTELIHGWAQAKRSPVLTDAAVLTLVVDGPKGHFLQAIHDACQGDTAIADSIELLPRMGLSIEQMGELYSRYHFVCQPSRAEGFGLIPLEARACGIPVIATECTGHADHLHEGQPGVVIVPHGLEEAVDDGPGAKAPSVDPDAIADALGRAYKDWPRFTDQAEQAAQEVGRKWNWASVTANFLLEHGEELGLVG